MAGELLLTLVASAHASVLTINGIVRGVPPSQPAVITSPADGSTVTEIPITVSGTCPSGNFVRIYRNGDFGGETACANDGTFSLQMDLNIGQNKLLARIFNPGEAEGPTASPVTVYYQPPVNTPASIPANTSPTTSSGGSIKASAQLLLTSNDEFQSYPPGSNIQWPIIIRGGDGPYSLSVDWGDGTNSLYSLKQAGTFTLQHKYKNENPKTGHYLIQVRAADINQQQAYLALTALITSKVAVAPLNIGIMAFGHTLADFVRALGTYWLAYTVTALMLASFWLGEKRMRELDRKGGLRLAKR